MSIGTLIQSIQDTLRQDQGVGGDAQRISQLVWMLFLKVFDDREAERELIDDGYCSPIPERLRWRNWVRLGGKEKYLAVVRELKERLYATS